MGKASSCLVVVALCAVVGQAADRRYPLHERAMTLVRESPWKFIASVALSFRTHHPQGLVKIGDSFFVSSVEIRRPTRRFAQPQGGYDRDTGEGVGHLFKVDAAGRLVADLTLGEGAAYHPGGIDFDGTHIWVPVAEYRPNSRSIVYRVDPTTLRAVEVFRFADHIGAIVHDTDAGELHGVSWGSRRFYRWRLGGDGRVTEASRPFRTSNASHYVDYQDCQYAGSRRMLCTGVANLQAAPDAPPFRLGGIDLVSLEDGRPLHQVPLPLWTSGGLSLARNATWFEPSAAGLRGYFLPEDDTSTLYVYEVETPGPD